MDLGIDETKLVVQDARNSLSATITARTDQLGAIVVDAQNETRRELDRVATRTESATERATQQLSQGLAQVSEEISRTKTAALGPQNSQLQLLPRAQARYNSHLRNDAHGCFEGTRKNTLKLICDWIGDESSSTPPIFWICGLAGIGKSTIAHTIAEEADLQNQLGASFFFSRSETDRRNPMLVYPSIAYQLAVFNTDLKKIIVRSLERDPDIGLARMETQFKKLIAEPLMQWARSDGIVVIVIDALDECSPESGAEEILAQLAAEVRKIPVPLKILITSRPELHIREKFRSPVLRNLSQSYALHNIEDAVVQADIELYLRRSLNDVAEAHGIPTPWPTELELQKLVERSGILFIFASTAVKFVGSGNRRDPQARLTLLLKEGISKGTSKYKEVDTLYTQVLQYALSQEVDDEEDSDELQHLFRVVLEAIVLLQDPLPSGPLELLLSLEAGVVRAAIRHLHSVIIVPDDIGEPVRLSHPSFYDYLNSPERCLDPRLSIQPESHTRLAKSCINTMINLLQKDPCGTGNPWLSNADIPDLHNRLRMAVPPHLRYCCQHFASHLQRAGSDDKELIELVDQFCNTKLLVWVEALSLLGIVDSGVASLQAMEDWYKKVSSPSRRTLDLLYDIKRVVLQFGYGIKKNSGHIFTTALLFSPPCSLTSQYASSAAVDCVILGKPSSWEETVMSVSTGNRLNCVTYSLDGAQIATGSEGGEVQVFSSATGGETALSQVHTTAIWCIAFSNDGKLLASASSDATATIWDVAAGTLITRIQGHSDGVTWIAFSPDDSSLGTASLDSTLRTWDVLSGREQSCRTGSIGQVLCGATSSNGRTIATGGPIGINIWDWESEKPKFHLDCAMRSSDKPIIAFLPNSNSVLCQSIGGDILVWDHQAGTLTHSTDSMKHDTFMALSPDGRQMACSNWMEGDRQALKIFMRDGDNWDAATCNLVIKSWEHHFDHVPSVAFSPDGSNLASVSVDGSLRIWELPTEAVADGDSLGVLPEPEICAASADGSCIVVASRKTSFAAIWASIPGSSPRNVTLEEVPQDVWCSPDGSLFLTMGHAQTSDGSEWKLRVWRTSTLECVLTWETAGSLSRDISVAFSSDGNLLASTFPSQSFLTADVVVASLGSGEALAGLQTFSKVDVLAMAFSEDKTRLLYLSGKEYGLWDLRNQSPLVVLREEYQREVLSCRFISPNQIILVTGPDQTTELNAFNLQSMALQKVDSVPGNSTRGKLASVKDGQLFCLEIRGDTLREYNGSMERPLCWIPPPWRRVGNDRLVLSGSILIFPFDWTNIGVLDLESLRRALPGGSSS
ncbi:hypothetical protein FRC01_001586 [Tulasnella sp. 417]|nr:hypothetical protein FRC01_001586 [Tulasnella sp. 417]